MKFERGRRYRLVLRPPGARTQTVTTEWNYLGRCMFEGDYEFDARPEGGTQRVPEELIVEAEDIGPAIGERS